MKNNKNLNIEIGKRLKICRTLANMTQEKLSEAVDCSVQTLSLVENGKRGLSLELTRKLARQLNVREEYLLCEDDFKTQEDKLISLYSNDNSSCLIQIEYLRTLGININIPRCVIQDGPEDDYNENPEDYFKTLIWEGNPFTRNNNNLDDIIDEELRISDNKKTIQDISDDMTNKDNDNFRVIRLKKSKDTRNNWITKHDGDTSYGPQIYVIVIRNKEYVLNYVELKDFLKEIDRFSCFVAENFFKSHKIQLNNTNIED